MKKTYKSDPRIPPVIVGLIDRNSEYELSASYEGGEEIYFPLTGKRYSEIMNSI